MSKVFIIAEAGVNHNGDLNVAKQLIDVAVNSGADAVKFQTFIAKQVVSRNAPKAEYQTRETGASESQLEMVKKLELNERDHEVLIQYARSKGIEFLSTPFDLISLNLLIKYGLQTIKIPSGEITNINFLLKISRVAKKIILSTGMSTLSNIELALGVLAFGFLSKTDVIPKLEDFEKAFCSKQGKQVLRDRVVILHCTTEYPTPYDEVNLLAMDTIAQAFALPVGYSDHTQGIHISLAAVARGATIIEKHFTLDRKLPGPDHSASIEPSELNYLVRQIRDIELAIGDGIKSPTKSEWKNRVVARRSLVASKAISKGELFTEENLSCKRPGNGISPLKYWDYLNSRSEYSYEVDDLIK
ncbi:N-acetylneuraminate synthase [Leptospira santarosai]|uniref:N-acetylneuraminate synthase n=1 Tax=Leptospira santarosai str. ZUN179 TaxID=1049985 RepID=M6UMG0_9LEPT|nr:N-acetylneuraminate synthase [Leptospira santarosai]EMO45770.1 N-acetylneuraminate synthase [Leptospira santarosai str. ZUN179]MDI7184870.1 N-acetylneuraminate synthase [Leptospira santarosai]MDI7201659.1 N-acetylneuraminate synthase [Leptospira santarosai]MDI7237475.1 N-acetylneuraminate synthase [Leptospira santarosai]UZN08543.1 N-acetylneuraminate synthase [Leptospira santarosai]